MSTRTTSGSRPGSPVEADDISLRESVGHENESIANREARDLRRADEMFRKTEEMLRRVEEERHNAAEDRAQAREDRAQAAEDRRQATQSRLQDDYVDKTISQIKWGLEASLPGWIGSAINDRIDSAVKQRVDATSPKVVEEALKKTIEEAVAQSVNLVIETLRTQIRSMLREEFDAKQVRNNLTRSEPGLSQRHVIELKDAFLGKVDVAFEEWRQEIAREKKERKDDIAKEKKERQDELKRFREEIMKEFKDVVKSAREEQEMET